jgi:BirA family biotin operon repressor/biotin-[acetyl-CoA-carboxylase] ligase
MKDIIILDEVTSTNDYLKNHYLKYDHETIVVAKKQTKGRGRLDRVWMSDGSNMYLSILYKNIRRSDLFSHLMNASVSVIRLLQKYNIEATIKYPNDILVNGRKICGILIENKGLDKLDYVIVGIGLNINQVDFEELAISATSMSIETSFEYNVDGVIRDFIRILDEQKNDLYNEYLTSSMVIGKTISYKNELYKIETIMNNGSLLLEGKVEVVLNEISLKELYEK